MNEPRFEVYEQQHKPSMDAVVDGEAPAGGGYGWRFRDGNGRITFIGGEGFTRRRDAHRAIHGAIADVHRASTEVAVMKQDQIVGGAITYDRMRPEDAVPIVDVNKAGDVIDPATGAPIAP